MQVHGVDTLVCRAEPIGVFTTMHVFMTIGVVPPGRATRELADGFARESVDYSIRHKGGLPRGMQSGTATVPVILTDAMAPGAEGWAGTVRHRQFAAFVMPVSVETSSSQVTYPRRVVIGAAYLRAMKRFIEEHVVDALNDFSPQPQVQQPPAATALPPMAPGAMTLPTAPQPPPFRGQTPSGSRLDLPPGYRGPSA